MRKSSLFSGIFYIILGLLFTIIAIQNVQMEQGWGMFTYVLILFATFDFGTGLRIIASHIKTKHNPTKK